MHAHYHWFEFHFLKVGWYARSARRVSSSFTWNFSYFCRFDKRITTFAEDKFGRDGIDVKTGSMVVKVSEKEISTKEMKNGQISVLPYGMAVWSTGIGTRPIIVDFMKQIGQVCFTWTSELLKCCFTYSFWYHLLLKLHELILFMFIYHFI